MLTRKCHLGTVLSPFISLDEDRGGFEVEVGVGTLFSHSMFRAQSLRNGDESLGVSTAEVEAVLCGRVVGLEEVTRAGELGLVLNRDAVAEEGLIVLREDKDRGAFGAVPSPRLSRSA